MSALPDSLDLVCVEIRPETRDVKTFVFRPRGGPIPYAAGQSMTLALAVNGETLHRTFSLSSAPGRGDTVSMTIKAHPAGSATRWLHDTLAVGDVVRAAGPRGRFTVAGRRSERLALVSAGSGASPLMAMLRHLADTAPETDVVWLHAARTPGDVLFAGELAELQRRMPALRVAVVVSRPEPGWFGFTGRISRRLLGVAVPDLGRREVFCCGPAGFMDEARLIHAAEGGDRDLFHVEHFGARRPPAASAATAGDAGGSSHEAFTIRLADKTFAATADETLLEAATRQNVVIPCGCVSGLCGTCRVFLRDGTVEMHHEGGISPDEEAQGYVLACSSRPRSDVTLAFERDPVPAV